MKRPRPRGDPDDLEAVATITSANSLASHPSALLLPDLRLHRYIRRRSQQFSLSLSLRS